MVGEPVGVGHLVPAGEAVTARDVLMLLLGAAFAWVLSHPQRRRALRAEVPSEDVATAWRRGRR
jgi:hypothetical protein